MFLNQDQRGFILSGLALLLILPVMLLSTSYLAIISTGGEAVSLQSAADKVHSAGLDVESAIKWMWARRGLPVDNYTLLRLEEACENATGMVVDISSVGDNLAKIRITVQDPLGRARFEDVLRLMDVV
ncbi:MAG: hypothetical protein U9M97_03345 [Candidatus Hadarchaeota archaeon]|nr:hypothetical protein [Candidatus Hadarchaeota archaeon]